MCESEVTDRTKLAFRSGKARWRKLQRDRNRSNWLPLGTGH